MAVRCPAMISCRIKNAREENSFRAPADCTKYGFRITNGLPLLWAMVSSFIQTVLSASEFHRICPVNTVDGARGLYHRLGLAPDPEELYLIHFLPDYLNTLPAICQRSRRMVKLILFLTGSTSSTFTSTISPTLTASSGWRIKRSVIREMCTRPS